MQKSTEWMSKGHHAAVVVMLLMAMSALSACGSGQEGQFLSANNPVLKQMLAEAMALREQLKQRDAKISELQTDVNKAQTLAQPPTPEVNTVATISPAVLEVAASGSAASPDISLDTSPDEASGDESTTNLSEAEARVLKEERDLLLQQVADVLSLVESHYQSGVPQTLDIEPKNLTLTSATTVPPDATTPIPADAVRQKFQIITTENTALFSENTQLKETLAMAQSEREEAQTRLRSEQSMFNAKNTALQEQLKQLESSMLTLADEKLKLSARLTQASGQLDEAQGQAARLTSSYEVLLREKSSLAETDAATRNELQDAREALEDAQSKVARLSGARGIYTVQNTDSLSTIAAFFYRDGLRWPDILQANAFLVSSADLIFPGMVLIIPQ